VYSLDCLLKLMAALAKLAMSPQVSRSAKEDVCSALLDLSAEEANQKLIATPLIFETLVRNLIGRREDHRRIREYAVRTLANLALHPCNRKRMSGHSSLLQSLLQFAAANPGNGLKREVKEMILQLAAEL
jgi:hypothetical protein